MKQLYTQLDDFEKWELDAYANGEDIPHLASFLNANPMLKAQFSRQEAFIAHLGARLDRFDCPSEDQLREYHLEELPVSEQQQIQMHLTVCPHCVEELAILQDFMALDDALPSVTPSVSEQFQPVIENVQNLAARVRIAVASLVQPSEPQTALAFRSQPIPTLEGTEQTTLLFEADDVTFSLMLQQDQKAQRRIVGYLLTPLPGENARCKLLAAASGIALHQTTVDDTGRFVFADIQPGNYQFMLERTGQSIMIPNLLLE